MGSTSLEMVDGGVSVAGKEVGQEGQGVGARRAGLARNGRRLRVQGRRKEEAQKEKEVRTRDGDGSRGMAGHVGPPEMEG